MATNFKPCSIDGCNGNAHRTAHTAKGFCRNHYRRWKRYGDPLGGETSRGEPIKFFREVVMTCQSEDCLIWPYGRARRGYGTITENGESVSVHRFVCKSFHGNPPSDVHQAAHSCGNGHLGCVNPKHLRWATPKDNLSDRKTHGTLNCGERQGLSKLNNEAVLEIRSNTSNTQGELAKKYGVSRFSINQVIRRRTWKHI